MAGRAWRRRRGEAVQAQAPGVAALLAWFWDRPGLEPHPFSIHSLCEAGRAHGCAPRRAARRPQVLLVRSWLGQREL